MAKKAETAEVAEVVKEVTVVDLDQFSRLDAGLQEQITDVTGELHPTLIAELNPLVVSMCELEVFRDLKYQNKPAVQKEFKEAIKTIRGFRAKVKKTKGLIKKPLLETGRKMDKIEKAFLEQATAILDEVEKEFKPFRDQEAKKKAEREAKRDAEKNEKIEQLAEQRDKQKLVIQRMETFLKNQTAIAEDVKRINMACTKYSEEALKQMLAKLSTSTFTVEDPDGVLLEDQLETLSDQYKAAQETSKTIIRGALDRFEAKRKEAETSVTPDGAVELKAPSIPSSNNPNYILDMILGYLDYAINGISGLEPALPKEKEICQRAVGGLEVYKGKITKAFKDEKSS